MSHVSCEVVVTEVAATSDMVLVSQQEGALKAGLPKRIGERGARPVSHESRDAAILAARALSRQPFGAFTFVCGALWQGEAFRGFPVTVDLEGEDEDSERPGRRGRL